jgi:hypothetical protein
MARIKRGFAIGGAALGAIFVVMFFNTRADVRDAKLAAERQWAQVINVADRQKATVAQWANAADSADRQAELSGAENRLRIERARYDELATEYRRHASGLSGWLVTMLGNYPDSLPLSSEHQW